MGKDQASVRTRGEESVLNRVLDEGGLVYDKIRGSLELYGKVLGRVKIYYIELN